MPAAGVDFVDPGLIALDLPLHFFRRNVPPNIGSFVQDQHELRHDRNLSFDTEELNSVAPEFDSRTITSGNRARAGTSRPLRSLVDSSRRTQRHRPADR